MDPFPPPLLQVFSTEELIGVQPGHIVKCCQTFSQVSRKKKKMTELKLTGKCILFVFQTQLMERQLSRSKIHLVTSKIL